MTGRAADQLVEAEKGCVVLYGFQGVETGSGWSKGTGIECLECRKSMLKWCRQDMYGSCKTVVRCAMGVTEEFKVEVGLHQGSALSYGDG